MRPSGLKPDCQDLWACMSTCICSARSGSSTRPDDPHLRQELMKFEQCQEQFLPAGKRHRSETQLSAYQSQQMKLAALTKRRTILNAGKNASRCMTPWPRDGRTSGRSSTPPAIQARRMSSPVHGRGRTAGRLRHIREQLQEKQSVSELRTSTARSEPSGKISCARPYGTDARMEKDIASSIPRKR